jgi:hypothetical protein
MKWRISVVLAVLASLFSMPGTAQGIAQMSDAPSLAGVIDLRAQVAPEMAALNYPELPTHVR